MKPTTIKVPGALLLDPTLSSSAMLLWAVHRLLTDQMEVTPSLLQAYSGLAKMTVRQTFAELSTRNLLHTPEAGTLVLLPSDLLLERQVGRRAKLLYGCIQLLEGFRENQVQSTYGHLSTLTGLTDKPVHGAIRELQEHGWLSLSQRTKFSPVQFSLLNPAATRRQQEVAEVKQRLAREQFKGQAIMRAMLSLLVASDAFDDDASPGFLINPYTNCELQFDRYYPPDVAFEFQGEQHFGPTEIYPEEQKSRQQQGRDLIKEAICARRGIKLVPVVAEELSLARMREKVAGHLPLRDLDDHLPLSRYLEAVGQRYRWSPNRGRRGAK